MLPTEIGTEAPDQLSIWPLEGERYAIDASYQGLTALGRADAHRQTLVGAGFEPALAPGMEDTWTLRLGPLSATGARVAIEAFLGPRDAGLEPALRQDLGGGWTIRMGALTHGAAWTAVEAFIGARAD